MKPHERPARAPTTKPAITALARRRRQVLYLRAYGLDYDQIADRLGVTKNVVHKDLIAVGQKWIPTGRGLPPSTKQPQVMYILGLIHGGLSPEEALEQLRGLPEQVAWLEARTATEHPDPAPTVPPIEHGGAASVAR